MYSWEKPVKGSSSSTIKKSGLLKRLLISGSSHNKKSATLPLQQQQEQQPALNLTVASSVLATGYAADAHDVQHSETAADTEATSVHDLLSGAVTATYIAIDHEPVVPDSDVAIPVPYVSPAHRLRLHDLQEQISPSG
jgi:hypothetical protein